MRAARIAPRTSSALGLGLGLVRPVAAAAVPLAARLPTAQPSLPRCFTVQARPSLAAAAGSSAAAAQPASKPAQAGPSATLQANDASVQISFADGAQTVFHTVWLRDHCRCPKCFHPKTRQRLVHTPSIPLDIKPLSLAIGPSPTDPAVPALLATWPAIATEDPKAGPHQSAYPLEWLRTHSYNPRLGVHPSRLPRRRTLWGAELAAKIDAGELSTPYEEVMASDAGLGKWLANVATYGIGFVDGVPVTMEDTEKVATRIHPLRNTHYGGFWSFEADMKHGDLAYSNLFLGAHNDTTYFTDPVGLQMWHQLFHDGTGGASLYVDGFHCAQVLKQVDPKAYASLSLIPIRAHAAGDDHVLVYPEHPSAGYPVLEHDARTGELAAVRYNNDDRSVLDSLSAEEVGEFYRALRSWYRVLADKKNEVWTQLRPERVVIIDNTRVLHGRDAFVGRRVMCGAYVDRDGFWSRVRTVVEGGAARGGL